MDKPNKRMKAYEDGLEATLQCVRAHPTGATARHLAEHLKCSKPTIYARLQTLAARGYRFQSSTKVREGARGPDSVAFKLYAEPAT